MVMAPVFVPHPIYLTASAGSASITGQCKVGAFNAVPERVMDNWHSGLRVYGAEIVAKLVVAMTKCSGHVEMEVQRLSGRLQRLQSTT